MKLKCDVRKSFGAQTKQLCTGFATGGIVKNTQDIGKLIGQFACTYPNIGFSDRFTYDNDRVLSIKRYPDKDAPTIVVDYLSLIGKQS